MKHSVNIYEDRRGGPRVIIDSDILEGEADELLTNGLGRKNHSYDLRNNIANAFVAMRDESIEVFSEHILVNLMFRKFSSKEDLEAISKYRDIAMEKLRKEIDKITRKKVGK